MIRYSDNSFVSLCEIIRSVASQIKYQVECENRIRVAENYGGEYQLFVLIFSF